MNKIKGYLNGGDGIANPKDVNGLSIIEGSVITYDWFDHDDKINEMRRMFGFMSDWSDERIFNKIHAPCFIVRKNDEGHFYGEGIAPPRNKNSKKLYLHDFRFKYTKVVI